LGQKNTPNPAKTFLFRERLISGQKTLQFQRGTLFHALDFGALGVAPPPPPPPPLSHSPPPPPSLSK